MTVFTSVGKEVLKDGKHLADAASVPDAAFIAAALSELCASTTKTAYLQSPASIKRLRQHPQECPVCKHIDGHADNCVERR